MSDANQSPSCFRGHAQAPAIQEVDLPGDAECSLKTTCPYTCSYPYFSHG
jgi:hypothetical protein